MVAAGRHLGGGLGVGGGDGRNGGLSDGRVAGGGHPKLHVCGGAQRGKSHHGDPDVAAVPHQIRLLQIRVPLDLE